MDQLIAQAIEKKASAESSLVSALAQRGAGDESFALAAANHLAQAELFPAALMVLEARVGAEPGSVQSLLTTAQIRAHTGDRDGCLDALIQVLRLEPANPIAWSSLAHLVSGQVDHPHDASSLAQGIVSLLAARKGAKAARSGEQAAGAVARAALSLLPETERIVVVDAGARDAHRDPRWRLLPPHRLAYHGFEPDPPECEKLNRELRELGISGAYYPVGLWDQTGRLPFHVNRAPGGSSFLRQNRAVTDRWKFENPSEVSLARDMFFEDRTVEETVTDVGNWAREAGVDGVDFVKLNVQGGEIAILKGMGSMLAGVQGVLVEVAFVESYLDRPLFGDVDSFLRGAGFTFFDLLAHHYVGRAASPFTARHAPSAEGQLGQLRSSWGQLIEGHALYLRDPLAAATAAAPRQDLNHATLRLAVVADVFGQTEFALELLAWLQDRLRGQDDRARALSQAREQALAILGSG